MAHFTAVYDACVLFPAPLRDLLLRLALTERFRARWTDEIHEEWINGVLRERTDLTRQQLERTRKLMDAAVPDCLVTGYEGMVTDLRKHLPDPNDAHVLAAAIRAQAGVIVTTNLKDFPSAVLAPYGIEAQHPDDFISHLIDLAPGEVYRAVRDQRLALKQPPVTVDDLLDTFLRQGLAQTVDALSEVQELL